MFVFCKAISGQDSLRAAAYSCHNDIACHSGWIFESSGVALVLLASGTSYCSGSLLNNTMQNYKPYFLTAFHCIDTNNDSAEGKYGTLSVSEKSAAQNWLFRFNYRKTTCNGSSTSVYTTYNQAYFKAAYINSDFALMELKSQVTHPNAVFLG